MKLWMWISIGVIVAAALAYAMYTKSLIRREEILAAEEIANYSGKDNSTNIYDLINNIIELFNKKNQPPAAGV